MRILLVSPYFPPQNAIASLRVHAFAKYWASQGEGVTVLTTAKRRDQHGLGASQNGFEVVELSYRVPLLFEVLRNRRKSGHAGNGAKGSVIADSASVMPALRRLRDRTGIFGSVRMPDLTDHWVGPAIRWCRSQRPWDVVVSSSGPYTAHLVAMALKREGRVKRWVADFRDLWVDNHMYRGAFPFTLRERALEKRCLERADLVVTVSDELARTLQAKTAKPVEIVFNGFDPQEAEALSAERIFPGDRTIRLVYTGTLYAVGQDPTPLLRSLSSLHQQRPGVAARLELVVAGQGHEQWLRLARRFGVEGMVNTCGVVGRSTALRMQRDADALVLLDWKVSNAGVLTGKLFDYLGAKAPILVVGGVAGSCIARMVERSRRGLHLGADEQRIREALIALVEAPDALASDPKTEFIGTFSRRCQSLRCLASIRSLIRSPL